MIMQDVGSIPSLYRLLSVGPKSNKNKNKNKDSPEDCPETVSVEVTKLYDTSHDSIYA